MTRAIVCFTSTAWLAPGGAGSGGAPAAGRSGSSPAGLPPGFVELDPERLALRCGLELEQRRRCLAQMERKRQPDGILEEFNELSVLSGAFDDPLGVLQNAAPDKDLRVAAQACLERLVPFGTELFQSAKLYARVAALKPKDAQEQSYRQWLIEQFEDTGATLPEEQRAQVKAIHDELNTLGLRFQRNVNDVTAKVSVTPSETEGLSEAWRQACGRDVEGNYLVGMDYPSFGPFMELAVDANARMRVWTEFQNRAGPSNLALMDRALVLRSQLAQVYGYADFATFALRRKMSGSPRAVNDFLQTVKSAVDRIEGRELETLRLEKLALANLAVDPHASRRADEVLSLDRWDLAFLQQRIKRSRYNVDQEALRAYFPTDAAVRFVMRIAERLYGIRFVACQVPVWHPDVRYFEVRESRPATEAAAGALDTAAGMQDETALGAIYLDLFPRAGKFSHAAVFGVRRGSMLCRQRPIKALICNFNDKGLTPSELETLFHEFGHAMHGVLSTARFADQAGTAVRQDFVEAPSMMFEEWARREVSLRGFAEVCPQCPVLSAQQIEQMAAARNFGAGIRYARQWLFASYDLALHTGAPKNALSTWERMEGATRLGHVPGTMMPASFSHLMGGYEAGYYSYMWSEVLALDMLSAFEGKLLDPEVGRRYRQSILEPGGSRPPQDLVEEFLGRKPNSEAFFAEITGRR